MLTYSAYPLLANTSYLENKKLTNICEYQLLANRGVSTLLVYIYIYSYGDTFYIDEAFVKINGKQHYLWPDVQTRYE